MINNNYNNNSCDHKEKQTVEKNSFRSRKKERKNEVKQRKEKARRRSKKKHCVTLIVPTGQEGRYKTANRKEKKRATAISIISSAFLLFRVGVCE